MAKKPILLPALLIATALVTSGCLYLGSTAESRDGEIEPAPEDDGDVRITPIKAPARIVAGERATWQFRVENHDTEAFPYSSICVPPWSYTLEDRDGNPIDMTGPLAYCMAYGEAHLQPGDMIETEWNWDGTRHDEASDSLVPLQAGTYQLTLGFVRQGAGAPGPQLQVPVQIAS